MLEIKINKKNKKNNIIKKNTSLTTSTYRL